MYAVRAGLASACRSPVFRSHREPRGLDLPPPWGTLNRHPALVEAHLPQGGSRRAGAPPGGRARNVSLSWASTVEEATNSLFLSQLQGHIIAVIFIQSFPVSSNRGRQDMLPLRTCAAQSRSRLQQIDREPPRSWLGCSGAGGSVNSVDWYADQVVALRSAPAGLAALWPCLDGSGRWRRISQAVAWALTAGALVPGLRHPLMVGGIQETKAFDQPEPPSLKLHALVGVDVARRAAAISAMAIASRRSRPGLGRPRPRWSAGSACGSMFVLWSDRQRPHFGAAPPRARTPICARGTFTTSRR